MAKAVTKKAEKTAKKPATPTITFGTWVRSARARGEAGTLLITIREDKKITEKTPLKSAETKYGTDPLFATLANRYANYCKKLAA